MHLAAGCKFEVLAQNSSDDEDNAFDAVDDIGGVEVPSVPAGYIPAL